MTPVEYEIAEGFGYDPPTHTIEIGIPSIVEEMTTEDEFIEHIADCITHEFLHALLQKMFNGTVSALFDIISHHFEQNYELHAEIVKCYCSPGTKTWKQRIDNAGFRYVFMIYGIKGVDFQKATGVCSRRGVLVI